MLEPGVVGTDAETHQVTAIISHLVRPRREQWYEEWLHGIAMAAHQFKGHLGVSVIRLCDYAHPEYVAIVKFNHYLIKFISCTFTEVFYVLSTPERTDARDYDFKS